ncbi:hypothetical protein GCM10009609_62770 [Pseudonocardia aurantiaca]|uniref:Uncharacterized protein n=1 Tax=Pseudonocardia aurantiaca TaxID=75290 RepID=A0ABW4FUN1_9PSEU
MNEVSDSLTVRGAAAARQPSVKKITDRKRFFVTDTLDQLLTVVVATASVQDRRAAP